MDTNTVLNQIMLELKSINYKIDNLEKTTVKKEDFERVVTNLATKEEVSKLATKEEISKLATKEEISKLATKEEISKLATKEEISKLATKEEMHELFNQNRKEMYDLVDKSTKEIAGEIRELSKNISKKMHKQHHELINEIRRVEKLNNNEHRIYEAQIRALQETNKYMQTKINKKALA